MLSHPRAALSLDYIKIRDDLYSKPLDLTPMLNAIRQRDKQALKNLFALGFKIKWIDPVRKKTVVRILAEEGDMNAISFLLDFLPWVDVHSITPDAIHGAMLGKHKELQEYLKQQYHDFDHHERVAHALTGNLPWNQDIEQYLKSSGGAVHFAEILYYLSLNGQTKTAIKLIDDFVEFQLSKLDYITRTYNTLAKYDILKDLIMKHPIIYDYLIKGAVYDDQFKVGDAYHLRRDRFIPSDDNKAVQACSDEREDKLAKAIASTGNIYKTPDFLYSFNKESLLNAAIEGAIEMGHFHLALKLCDQARQLDGVNSYFRVLINAMRFAMNAGNFVLVKLILRRFPNDFKFDFDSNIGKLTYIHVTNEKLDKLRDTIKDPAAYLLALYIFDPQYMSIIVNEYQSTLGISADKLLTPENLRSLFSNRSLINFILSGIHKRFPLACNHDIHEKLMAEISNHKMQAEHLKLLKEVVLNNKNLFCHTAARKKIPESYYRFSEYLYKYNRVREQLVFYIKEHKGYHIQKAEMLLAELDKTVNIAEIQALLHHAVNTFSYYSFYEFTFARALPNDLTPILRECIKIADSQPNQIMARYF